MPKSVEIENFSAKLGLVAKRLNWSAGKLAQQVGVDKSVVARWLNGDSRPSSHSLMRLTAAMLEAVPSFSATNWDLPIAQFSQRTGLPPIAAAPAPAMPARLTLGGLTHPPDTRWGKPYLGLWVGFYQSVINHGIPQLFAAHFAIDELGLRMRFTVGPYFGEGPVLASPSHLQCLADCGPSYDRLILLVLNGVHEPQARVIDGLICVMAGDPSGTPAASPLLMYRIDDGIEFDPVAEMHGLGATIGRINEHAKAEAKRSGDSFAVMSDLAPVDILRTVCPVIGVPREDGEVDHMLRMPAARSLAAGTITLEDAPADADAHHPGQSTAHARA